MLFVPWVSLAEARRTLVRIVKEDLGFHDAMMTFAVRQLKSNALSKADHQHLNAFANQTQAELSNQLTTLENRVEQIAQDTNVVVIEPNKEVIEKTLSLFPVKSLPPFDEMVLGAVLVKAAEVKSTGATLSYFCNLNKKDFDPANRPQLATEYEKCGLHYLSDFRVP